MYTHQDSAKLKNKSCFSPNLLFFFFFLPLRPALPAGAVHASDNDGVVTNLLGKLDAATAGAGGSGDVTDTRHTSTVDEISY